jgi:hypothetical protein
MPAEPRLARREPGPDGTARRARPECPRDRSGDTADDRSGGSGRSGRVGRAAGRRGPGHGARGRRIYDNCRYSLCPRFLYLSPTVSRLSRRLSPTVHGRRRRVSLSTAGRRPEPDQVTLPLPGPHQPMTAEGIAPLPQPLRPAVPPADRRRVIQQPGPLLLAGQPLELRPPRGIG